MKIPQYNATVYSVTGDPLSTPGSNNADVIITLLAPEGSADLKDTVFNRLKNVVREVSEQKLVATEISRFGKNNFTFYTNRIIINLMSSSLQ